jgi:TPR repeat protein
LNFGVPIDNDIRQDTSRCSLQAESFVIAPLEPAETASFQPTELELDQCAAAVEGLCLKYDGPTGRREGLWPDMFELVTGRHRARTGPERPEAFLQGRIASLESELAACKRLADDRARSIRALKIGVAGLIVALGLELSINTFPLVPAVARLIQTASTQRAVDDAGHAEYQRGNYAAALQHLRPLAEQGDVRAQYTLGLMYYHGRGVPRNDPEAMRWLRLAADQGHAPAQFNLGVMFSEGHGAAKNEAEAVRWYRLAAEQGNPEAQYNLGLAYAKGDGIAQSYVDGHLWFSLAAERFSKSEPRSYELAVRNRNLIAAKMTSEEIAVAQKLARQWSQR